MVLALGLFQTLCVLFTSVSANDTTQWDIRCPSAKSNFKLLCFKYSHLKQKKKCMFFIVNAYFFAVLFELPLLSLTPRALRAIHCLFPLLMR